MKSDNEILSRSLMEWEEMNKELEQKVQSLT